MIEQINQAADAWSEMAIRTLWQGVAIALLVWIASRLWKRIPANISAALWLVVSLKLVIGLLPIAVALPFLPAEPLPPSPDFSTLPLVDALPFAIPAPAVQALPSLNLNAYLLLGWLAGVAALLATSILMFIRVRIVARLAAPVSDPDLVSAAQELTVQLGIRRVPELRSAPTRMDVVTFGAFRPMIIISPTVLDRCSLEELKLVLAHELAHVKRGDVWLSLIPQLATTLLFFHPAAWLAAREFELARESACDEVAVRSLNARSDTYGRLLMKLCSRREIPASTFVLGISSHFRALSRRISMLDQLSSPASTRRRSRALIAIGLTGAFLIAPWTLVRAQSIVDSTPKTKTSAAADSKSVTTAPKKATSPKPKPNNSKVTMNLSFASSLEIGRALKQKVKKQGVLMFIDEKRNALLLSGPSDQVDKLVKYIYNFEKIHGTLEPQTLHTYPIQHVDAAALAKQLVTEFKGKYKPSELKVLVDVYTNSVLIQARPEIEKAVAARLRELDRDEPPHEKRHAAIPLQYSSATQLAATIQLELLKRYHSQLFKLTTDSRENTIFAEATPAVMQEIEQMVKALDEKQTTTDLANLALRRFLLSHISAERALPLVKDNFGKVINFLSYDPVDNSLVIRADEKTLGKIKTFITSIDRKPGD